jgi:uncharacterized membrane protein YtjA (UPF0391 family)
MFRRQIRSAQPQPDGPVAQTHPDPDPIEKGNTMLSWTLTFLVIALIAGLLGFTGIAGAATGMAKILFMIFLVVFLLSLLLGGRRRV